MSGPDSEQTFADLLNGLTLDSGRRRGRKRKRDRPEARTISVPSPSDVPSSDEDGEAASIVRPYSWTGGRTTSDFQLEIETLVSAGEELYAGPIKAEYQDVIALCERPRSVAEVAALLGIPLGVAKVLLGDMAERGLLEVHATAVVEGDNIPDLGLMERVLSGLRKL
ncbi:DUF742 domain-containing protein [Umezawaea tangerina]|uniref:Uncharacterized protein DUF742 n=1 Tax=Umezawaea tangerina TaxID=84725 RepID=A0A2T0S8J9_9PSEU|nr:DUF742 domain-containing protein [Umezawaea tangerina]PRY29716.1 uncharacterized protein DUF742 [Umezawaea tangerina]